MSESGAECPPMCQRLKYDRTGMLSDAIQGNAYGNCPACQTTGASNAVEAPDTAQEAPLVSTMYICILTNSLIHVNVKRFTFYMMYCRLDDRMRGSQIHACTRVMAPGFAYVCTHILK